jgi:hypothetical protein
MSVLSCIPCRRARAIAERQLTFLREQAQQRAIQNDSNYAIYLDQEDNKLHITEFETATNRGYKIVEFIPRFEATT